MGLIIWIILGGIAGWLASLVMKTDAEQGMVMNIVVGIVGAVIGGFLMGLLGYGGVDGFNLYSILVATLGSVALIWMVKAVA